MAPTSRNTFATMILWTIVALIFISAQVAETQRSDEKRLYKKLMTQYARVGKAGRPVMKYSDTVTVQHGLQIIQILDLNEKEQTLTVKGWPKYKWMDPFLKWNPNDNNGAKQIRVSPNDIWTPDILLYNNADERSKEDRDALMVVSNTGEVLWVPPAIYKISCTIDVTNFPFDQQVCFLKFGSWTYDGMKVNITHFNNESEVGLGNFVPSNEWQIIKAPAVYSQFKYPCCEEPYPDLRYFLVLRRIPSFYTYVLVFPSVLLAILTLVIFWLPPESPMKTILGVIIFLAFFLLLSLLSEIVPSSGVSKVGRFYMLNMFLVALSLFFSVIMINLCGEKSSGLSPKVKKVFRVIGRICCVSQLDVLTDDNNSQQLMMQSDPDKSVATENDNEQMKSVAGDVCQIRETLRSLLVRLSARDTTHRFVKEWRVVAQIIDRCLFVCYLIIIIIAIAALLSMKYKKYENKDLFRR